MLTLRYFKIIYISIYILLLNNVIKSSLLVFMNILYTFFSFC